MESVSRYEHHFGEGSASFNFVIESVKGMHRKHCLCFNGCEKFKIGSEDNCEIAKAVYGNCVKFNIVTPVYECPKYSAQK